MATKTVQSIKVRIRGVSITGLYTSPKSKEKEEVQFLEGIRTIS